MSRFQSTVTKNVRFFPEFQNPKISSHIIVLIQEVHAERIQVTVHLLKIELC